MLQSTTEQTEEFNDYGLKSDADKKRILRRVMALFTVLLMSSVSLNIYLMKHNEAVASDSVEREERHSAEMKQLQNEHALSMRTQAAQFNAVILEILNRQMNMNLKLDTTVNK